MAAVTDGPGCRELHSLTRNQALRRRRYLDGTYLRVGATGKWQDKANKSQHLKAVVSEHNLASKHFLPASSVKVRTKQRIRSSDQILVQ